MLLLEQFYSRTQGKLIAQDQAEAKWLYLACRLVKPLLKQPLELPKNSNDNIRN